MANKLGRKPRKFDKRIPRASMLYAASGYLAPAPISIDYSQGLGDDFGVMLNDKLGDCTCAAFYHARQIWTGMAGGKVVTDSDDDVLALYKAACGYNPADPASDQGGIEQDVLAYLLNTGAPMGSGVDKINAYVEIDYKNLDDLKRVIADCGVAYIGIEVPQSVMDHADDTAVWWNTGGDNTIIGGHAVVLVGYDLDTFTCISWGRRYKITNAFLSSFLDEAYGIIDSAWLEATGKTPFGMTLGALESIMNLLKND